MGYRKRNVRYLLERGNILHMLLLLCYISPLTLARNVFYSHFVNHWRNFFYTEKNTYLEKMVRAFSENCLADLVFSLFSGFFLEFHFNNLAMPPYWRSGSQRQMWIWYSIPNPVPQLLALGCITYISTFIQSESSPKEFGIALKIINANVTCQKTLTLQLFC